MYPLVDHRWDSPGLEDRDDSALSIQTRSGLSNLLDLDHKASLADRSKPASSSGEREAGD